MKRIVWVSILFVLSSQAIADIELVMGRLTEVKITGEIRKGDFDDFKTKLKLAIDDSIKRDKQARKINKKILYPYSLGSIQLNSPGGNMLEAMKIGKLIRSLFLKTIVWSSWEGNLQASCSSACFFVFVSGVSRVPNIYHDKSFHLHDGIDKSDLKKIGLHRPSFEKNYYKNNYDSYDQQYKNLLKVSRKYLFDMGVKQKVVDKVFSISSNDIEWLSLKDFDDHIGIYPMEVHEWANSQCLGLPRDKQYSEALKDYFFYSESDTITRCIGRVLTKERYKRALKFIQ